VATDWGNAVRYNGLGRYDDALVAAERAAGDPRGLGTPMWLLADLVEAAARSGKPERAVGPLERLTEIAEANGSDWALGFLARSRALLGEGQAAERLYREAIDRLGRTLIRVAHARTLLVYGEWLRRENRRVDAREQLRAAHAMLSDIGMEVFARACPP
jgi:tetratricopeptide (TPR) repeat protein